ncbi:tetratricopeptide repeat-containing sensor histidine kinase [Fulvivirga lutimaris]|uniref:tetratricopeptide repeat-containing sensor histidine kinase n=1 Tax=Fulvivirga lutimaris TaxID=1819566 RepID=UPI0012BD6225|nr:tetratricopeptide repeat protein [Fulvivirga lutimaris]MTI41826.1 tetratricopeptide repeat protein [Fulvivirga lutimaris]
MRYFLLALLYLFANGKLHSQSKLDSLEAIVDSKKGSEKVDILNTLGFDYAFSSLEKAKKYSYQGLKEAKAIGYGIGQARALINVGYNNLDYHNNDSAAYYFKEAVNYAKSIADTVGIANAFNALGNLQLQISDFKSAASSYNDALFYQQKMNEIGGITSAYNNIGKVMEKVGSYDKAIEYYLKALKLNKENNFERKRALNLLNISMAYIYQKDYKMIIPYLDEAGSLPILKTNLSLQSNYTNQLGLLKMKLKEYDSAIYFFNKTIEIDKERGRSYGTALHNMSEAYFLKGDYSKAYAIAKEGLDMKRAGGDKASIIFSLHFLARIHNALEQHKTALEYSQEAYDLSKEINHKDREEISMMYLSESYQGLGDYKKAWNYRMQYEALKDSLFNIQKSEQMAAMSALFETEKKQQTIELQQSDLKAKEASLDLAQSTNTKLIIGVAASIIAALSILLALVVKLRSNKKLAQQKLEIEAKNNENETLLKEIHHRVKNNLQIISSILNIQSRNLEDQIAKDAVNEGRSRIKSMSLIHEKLYGNNQLSVINMKEYIEELNDFLFSSYKPKNEVKRNIDVDSLDLDIDTAVPVGLILNELISNSLKYAFNNEDGELKISLKSKANNHILSVMDSGPGLPEDFRTKKSMGMRLVNALTEQLNGIVEISEQPGTSFTLKFTSPITAR